MNRWLCSLGLVLALASSPTAAASQLEPPDLDNYIRWGPLRVRPGLALTNLGYDDNIFVSSADPEFVSSGGPESDYTGTLSPRVEGLVLFGHRSFLTFQERLGYTFYATNRDQNYLDHEGRARLTWPLKRFGLFAEGRAGNTKQRPIDQDDIRPERRGRHLTVGGVLLPGWRTEIEISHEVSSLTHVDPDFNSSEPNGPSISDRLDRDERLNALSASYHVLGRSRLRMAAWTKAIDFDQALSSGTARDTREWRLLAGMDFGEGGLLEGSFQTGWGRIDAEAPSLPDFSGAVGELELIFRLSERTRVRLEAHRLPGFGVSEVNTYYLDTEFRYRLVHYLNRLVGVEVGASTGTLTFPESTLDFEREDTIDRYAVGVRLRLPNDSLGRRVEYSLTLGRYRRASNQAGLDRERTTVGLTAVLGF